MYVHVVQRAARCLYNDGRCFCTRALRDKTVAEVSPERDTVRAPRYVSAAASPRAIRMRARSRRSDLQVPRSSRTAPPLVIPPSTTTTRHRTGLEGRGGTRRIRTTPAPPSVARQSCDIYRPSSRAHRPAVIARRQRHTVLPLFLYPIYYYIYYMYCIRGLPFFRGVYVSCSHAFYCNVLYEFILGTFCLYELFAQGTFLEFFIFYINSEV